MRNELTQAAAFLRETAVAIEAITTNLTLPVENLDIKGAFETIRGVVGKDEYITINPTFNQFAGEKIQVLWRVYDGGSHFEGPTLQDAVNELLKAHQTPKQGDSASDIKALESELAEPLPL